MDDHSRSAAATGEAGTPPSARPIPGRRRVLAWALWDPGTQPFASVITTFVFSVYIVSPAFGPDDRTSTALAWTMSLAGLLIALLAPITGHWADRHGRRVGLLRWLTWALAVLAGCLFFIQAKASFLVLGLALLGLGIVVSDVASSLYNGLLDEVAPPGKVGRVSGLGWGMGYLGGIVALLVIYLAWIRPEVGLFGVTSTNGMDIRVSMLFCAAWIALMTLPTFVVLRDPPHPASDSRGPRRRGLAALGHAYVELWHSVVRIWRTSPNTVVFLLAAALFRDGLNGVFQFGGPIARQTFGFSAAQVLVFGIAANLVAGVSTMLVGLLDDRLGPRRVIIGSLVALIACAVVVFALHDGPATVFWIAGMGMCAFVGPAQSAGRSFLTRVCPHEQQGEVFGLYATTGKVVSFLAPALFGLFITVGARLTGGGNNQYWGILGIIVVLVAGLAVMAAVRDPDPVERSQTR